MKKKRLLIIVGSAFLMIVAFLALFLFGVFQQSDIVTQLKRPYILSSEAKIPDSLPEYLNTGIVSLEGVLNNEKLTAQLLDAGELTDIVDSRLSLNNLRSLQSEAKGFSEGAISNTSMPAKTSFSENDIHDGTNIQLNIAGGESAFIMANDTNTQNFHLVKDKIDFLLAKDPAVMHAIEANVALKCVWIQPDDVLLHWTPHGDWVPEDGYRLYRTVGGNKELIAEGLGSIDNIAGVNSGEYAEYIKTIFEEAALTPQKLSDMGLKSVHEFNTLVYQSSTPGTERVRISGEKDFSYIRDSMLTIPATLEDKLPAKDTVQRSSVLTVSSALNGLYAGSKEQSYSAVSLSVLPLQPAKSYAGSDTKRADTIDKILEARKMIIAKSFTDSSFASDAGFGWHDSLAGLKLLKGTAVTYTLESSAEQMWTCTVKTGEDDPLSAPAGLEGYGMDNAVSLRWQAPIGGDEKTLISGYYIERKRQGEAEFKRLEAEPVAISYSLDETGIYFEVPVFYQDETLKNGEKAYYRIQALDIFGRKSEYSEPIEITVYKVTPPGTPFMDEPVLSTKTVSEPNDFITKLISSNRGAVGTALYVNATSEDTRSVVFYRARALGTGPFDSPVEIGRAVLNGKAIRITKKKAEAGFFDKDITPGYYYKYWAAAVDDWGNESAWSDSRIAGVPDKTPPQGPTGLAINFIRNDLSDMFLRPAGFGTQIIEDKTYKAVEIPNTVGGGVKAYDGANLAKNARTDNVIIGVPVSRLGADTAPGTLSAKYGNLPEPDMIHAVIALTNANLLPDGTAMVNWTPYSGNGLSGYHVYRAEVDGKTLAEIQNMSTEEAAEAGIWKLVQANTPANQLTDKKLTKKDGRIYLYMICLVPENEADSTAEEDSASIYAAGGWVQLSWTKPDDPQVQYCRVYRSEVTKNTLNADPQTLQWTLISDRNRYAGYTEKVDQTYAHYYCYKVTAVSVWGVESSVSAIMQFRIPAASPPQTPAMLLPLSQKGKIQINWAGVPHASKYSVYRAVMPKISEEDIVKLQTDYKSLYEGLFISPVIKDSFLAEKSAQAGKRSLQPAANTPVISVDKFNSMQFATTDSLAAALGDVSAENKLKAFKYIADKYGPLALAPYGGLSEEAAGLVVWVKIGEAASDETNEQPGALNYTDDKVVYGYTYLYTVQAENEDGLVSARPMPVSATPRRSKPFDPVTGLKGAIVNGNPEISWNQAQEEGLSWQESRRDVAGYIVYRSFEKEGRYYQASPLLDTVEWTDKTADPAASNWYKVKVVDTGGYFSDFSAPVLIQGEPGKIMDNFLPGRQLMPAGGVIDTYSRITAGGFELTDVKVNHSTGAGSGFLSIGVEELVEVNIEKAAIIENRLMRGNVTLKQPVYLPKAGLTLNALTFSGEALEASIRGYLNSPASGTNAAANLIGGLYGIQFSESIITPDGVITVAEMPGFLYGNIYFEQSKDCVIALNRTNGTPFIKLSNGTTVYYPDLETIDHKGLAYKYTQMSFDKDLRLSGKMQMADSPALRLAVPAGLGIKAEKSTLVFRNGSVNAAESSLQGKLILPFQTYKDQYGPLEISDAPVVSSAQAGYGFNSIFQTLADKTAGADIPGLAGSLTQQEAAELDGAFVYLARRMQSNALAVLPGDPALQLNFSTISFNITAWQGSGFLLEDAAMTPVYIGNGVDNTSQSLGLTPGAVSVDLDRSMKIAAIPAETQEPEWMGIIVNEGRLSLPTEYVKTDSNKRMSLDLTPGELLYSLNGFSYQNIIYSAAGIPANFGDSLGGFRDVILFDCMIDMYANKYNLEMNTELGIPLFGFQKLKAKLYTSEDTIGLQCTISGTDKISLSGSGQVKVKISGGCLQSDGLHINGQMDVDFSENRLKFSEAAFNELIIPADMQKMTALGNTEGHFGNALLEKPIMVKFHGFNMEVRSITLTSTKQIASVNDLSTVHREGLLRSMQSEGMQTYGLTTVTTFGTQLALNGATQLSDNMCLNASGSPDRIVIGDITGEPDIDYSDSKSHMYYVYEDYITIEGDVTPAVDPSDEDIVYFDIIDTFDMLFNKAADLEGYPVQANGRIGYDRGRDRYFFALGSYYNDTEGEGISIYYGYINQICGILAYNMDLVEDENGRFIIPKESAEMFAYVDSIPVSTTYDSNCFFASACNIYLTVFDIKVCEIRDVYLLVEAGPTIESGGDFYGPFDLEKLISGEGFVFAGPGKIGYYHADKLYTASTSLIEQPMYTLKVSGDMGIELCPEYWDIRLGYPNPMVARTDYEIDGRFGLHFHASQAESFIKAQASFGYDTGTIYISPEVYVRGNISIGAGGEYNFDDKIFRLTASVSGGVEGGLHVLKKNFPIIHLWLDGTGDINTANNRWDLHARADIHYSLDLWVHDFEGTVTWVMDRTL